MSIPNTITSLKLSFKMFYSMLGSFNKVQIEITHPSMIMNLVSTLSKFEVFDVDTFCGKRKVYANQECVEPLHRFPKYSFTSITSWNKDKLFIEKSRHFKLSMVVIMAWLTDMECPWAKKSLTSTELNFQSAVQKVLCKDQELLNLPGSPSSLPV